MEASLVSWETGDEDTKPLFGQVVVRCALSGKLQGGINCDSTYTFAVQA